MGRRGSPTLTGHPKHRSQTSARIAFFQNLEPMPIDRKRWEIVNCFLPGELPMANLLWLQGGACSGNTMSFLNAEEPSVCDLVTDFGIKILWHPSLGLELGEDLKAMLKALLAGEVALDLLVFEGTVVQAPNGTGEWNRFAGRPMKD